MKIPKELAHMEKIRVDLHEMLSSSNALLDHCVEMITVHPESISRADINAEIVRYRTSHAICIKACKVFRASIGLAGIGSEEELNILSRTLFETFVALNFVLQEKLEISKKLGKVTPEMRAKLYVTHGILKRRTKMHELKADPNWTSTIPNEFIVETNADHAVAEIGEDWAKRLTSGNRTYSTLNLRDLISRYDEPAYNYWYNFLYSDQSQFVHASDPISHIKHDAESSRFVARWFGSTRNLGMSLGMNGLLLYGCFSKLHEYCLFYQDVFAELNRLGGEIQVRFDHCFQSSSS
ncbi:MAG: DUF5677 domain-containing protein [Planctomycetota bacterium]